MEERVVRGRDARNQIDGHGGRVRQGRLRLARTLEFMHNGPAPKGEPVVIHRQETCVSLNCLRWLVAP
jgi:hypothetical protein